MTAKIHYLELTPQEFRDRLAAAPIAYLPLGTLEWHGEHMPLGADGIQSQGFFEVLAREVGGVVLPMLFVGPDRMKVVDGQELYGMDLGHYEKDPRKAYPNQQLAGSAYWAPEDLFGALLEAVIKQVARAGFKIVVAHGHGPSGGYFGKHLADYQAKYGVECLHCWGSEWDSQALGIQVDHAGKNETSLVMALRPELVQMQNLPTDRSVWPVAVGGLDPRDSSAEFGQRAIELQRERMTKLLRAALAKARRP